MNLKPKIEDLLKGIQKNVPLAFHTTFKIGGPAKYFYTAKTKEDLIKAIKVAKKINLPFFILGGGSNLLISDKGFEGMVINFQFSIFNFQKNKITAGAGLALGKLVRASAEKGLSRLEWAIGIPGTLGGAIRGNAGAFGKSMKDIIKQVEVFDLETEKIKILKNEDCQFDYRESIFKKKKNLIILSAKIELEKGSKKEIEEKMKENLDYRKKTQPLNFSSAGSVFKNPRTRTSSVRGKPSGLSAAYLIEKCGLKGRKIGEAQISKKHANFIVNLGKAEAEDVRKLINLIKKKVKENFGVELKEEIQFLGF